MYRFDGKFRLSETILFRLPLKSKQDAMIDWQTETLGCMTTSPAPAPMILPIMSPTVVAIIHQPSSHERMPRVDHISAYSCIRSRARRGIAPSEWLIMQTVLSSMGNSLRHCNRSSITVLHKLGNAGVQNTDFSRAVASYSKASVLLCTARLKSVL